MLIYQRVKPWLGPTRVYVEKPLDKDQKKTPQSVWNMLIRTKDESWGLPSGKLTVRPWQSSGLVQISFHMFPLKLGYFQGPTVYLPEGISLLITINHH